MKPMLLLLALAVLSSSPAFSAAYKTTKHRIKLKGFQAVALEIRYVQKTKDACNDFFLLGGFKKIDERTYVSEHGVTNTERGCEKLKKARLVPMISEPQLIKAKNGVIDITVEAWDKYELISIPLPHLS